MGLSWVGSGVRKCCGMSGKRMGGDEMGRRMPLTMVCWSLKVLLPDITSPTVETPPIWTEKGMRWELVI